MRLLFSTTSHLQVTLTEQFSHSVFSLYFADRFNTPSNPPSSNPFKIYIEYTEIFRHNDRLNSKYVMHRRSLRRGTRSRLEGTPELPEALKLIKTMGMHGIRPVLAILEADTYIGRGNCINALPPSQSASPTSVEYRLAEIYGPNHPDKELHLEELFS